jgi:hypothetical protein
VSRDDGVEELADSVSMLYSSDGSEQHQPELATSTTSRLKNAAMRNLLLAAVRMTLPTRRTAERRERD